MQALNLFLWLCAFGLAVVIPLTLVKRRAVLIGWFLAYLLAYSYFSLHGQYVTKSATNLRQHWMPLHCRSSQPGKYPASLTPLGAFFLPAVCGDRLLVHRTQKPGSARTASQR